MGGGQPAALLSQQPLCATGPLTLCARGILQKGSGGAPSHAVLRPEGRAHHPRRPHPSCRLCLEVRGGEGGGWDLPCPRSGTQRHRKHALFGMISAHSCFMTLPYMAPPWGSRCFTQNAMVPKVLFDTAGRRTLTYREEIDETYRSARTGLQFRGVKRTASAWGLIEIRTSFLTSSPFSILLLILHKHSLRCATTAREWCFGLSQVKKGVLTWGGGYLLFLVGRDFQPLLADFFNRVGCLTINGRTLLPIHKAKPSGHRLD